MDRPGILNRMKHIPTRNSLFINANYTRREREGGGEGGRVTPADALVPLPVSVICYLLLHAFFRFNKRRLGFSVTFMDGLVKKEWYRRHKCMQKYMCVCVCVCIRVSQPSLSLAGPWGRGGLAQDEVPWSSSVSPLAHQHGIKQMPEPGV